MKKFISFEGGEGSGKSTQSKLLVKSLKKINLNTFLTREPGGTKFSEKIRKILIGKVDYEMLPETELLLIYAARHEHVKKKIIPNLKKRIVICDRFVHSTICYQVLLNKISLKKLDFLHKNFSDNLIPNITFYLDIDPRVGVNRSKIKNKFELKNMNFHKKIRQKFRYLSKNDKKFFTINAELSKKQVHNLIIDRLNKIKLENQLIPYSL